MTDLTATALERLLERLGEAPAAAERYESLRSRLARLFEWRGCEDIDSDILADQVLDRVAAKLAAGVEIEDVAAYSASVARFVWLEHTRKKKEFAAGDDLDDVPIDPRVGEPDDADERLNCLRKCMFEVTNGESDRRLIVEYYDAPSGVKAKDVRKRLAESLGISVSALKVRACHLRGRLEQCINNCIASCNRSGETSTIQ